MNGPGFSFKKPSVFSHMTAADYDRFCERFYNPLDTWTADTATIQDIARDNRELFDDFVSESFEYVSEFGIAPFGDKTPFEVRWNDPDGLTPTPLTLGSWFGDVFPVDLIPDDMVDRLRAYTEAKDGKR